jgi:hypothetical protein
MYSCKVDSLAAFMPHRLRVDLRAANNERSLDLTFRKGALRMISCLIRCETARE